MSYINRHDVGEEQAWRNTFGERIYQLMKDRGLAQYELAVRADISVGVMSNIINGRGTPSVYNVLKIADALGCTVDDLIYFH